MMIHSSFNSSTRMRMAESESQEYCCVMHPQNRVILLSPGSPPLSMRHDQRTVYKAQVTLAQPLVSRAADPT